MVAQFPPFPLTVTSLRETSTEPVFQEIVAESFRQSGVGQWLESRSLEFVGDTALTPDSDSNFPIHEFLDWDIKRFAHRARANQEALLLFCEDRTPWQAILDRPSEKKKYQYLAPLKAGNRAFLPHVPKAARREIADRYQITDQDFLDTNNSFWDWVENHPEIPLVITEGAKKSLSLLQLGYVGIALYGCSCLGSPDLDRFLRGRKVTIAMDSDEKPKTRSKVERAVIKGSQILAAKGAKKVAIATWETELGKGIDDLQANLGAASVVTVLGSAVSRTKFQQQVKARNTPEFVPLPKEEPAIPERPPWGKSKNANLWHTLEFNWGSRLRFNEMTLRVEMDGEPYDLDMAFIDVATEFDIDSGGKTVQSMMRKLALRNSYHPFREYLKTLINHPSPADISNLATRYLGNSDPLANVMIKKTLIALARRTFQPGCKVDTVCIFQGQTGWKKSTFWETLVSTPFFCDNLSEGGANKKDEKLKLRRYSIIEYSEIDTVWRQKDVSEMKAFLSSKVDSIRPPYGATIEDFPRSSIFVGTTNKQEFLSDPTGERRYWVLEAKNKIDIKALEKEREQILAAAVKLHLAGQIHWLTDEEDQLLEKSNQEFKTSDTWEDIIFGYLDQMAATSCTVLEILTNALKIVEAKDQGRREQMRVADILQTHGWKKGRKKLVDGKRSQLWEKGGVGSAALPQNEPEVVQEVVLPFSPDTESVSETGALPALPFCDNLKHSFQENKMLNEQELDLVEYIRTAIAAGDSQTAQHLQATIKDVCEKGEASREKVWNSLTDEERSTFTALVQGSDKVTSLTAKRQAKPAQIMNALLAHSPKDQEFQDALAKATPAQLQEAYDDCPSKNGARGRALWNAIASREI